MQNITEPSVAVEEVIAIDAGKRTNVNVKYFTAFVHHSTSNDRAVS